MLDVSAEVKSEYATPSSAKTLVIYFPELDYTVPYNTVHSESLTVSEAIMDNDTIEFIGCIPSKLQVSIQNFGEDVADKEIHVSIFTENTEEEPVPIFKGIVDTVTQQSNKQIKEIVAYDFLYTKGNIDIAQWYIENFIGDWENGTTLKTFRDSLFEEIGLDVVETELVNDSLFFYKQYSPVNMKALDIIRYICQINGVFGIMNRYGVFEFRRLKPIAQSTPIFVSFYKEADYQEFSVKPVDLLTIRQSDQVEGVSYGLGDNNYIIQGNFFTLNLKDSQLLPLAERLYPIISGISYVPYKATQVGYPWVECGDVIAYDVYDFEASQEQGEDVYTRMNFYVFDRYLKGIQALRDTYEAQGEKEQTVFITNINAQIETVKDQIEEVVGQLAETKLSYLPFTNEDRLVIEDGERKQIAEQLFALSQANQIGIQMEYLLECETTEDEDSEYISDNDLVITVNYLYDNVLLDSRIPIETLQDGKHILSLFYPINVQDMQQHTFEVWLECEGGRVVIEAYQALNVLVGQGLTGNLWDGSINAEDNVLPIEIPTLILKAFTDIAEVSMQQPTSGAPSDNIARFTLPTLSIVSFTESAGVNVILQFYKMTVSSPATYSATYVTKDTAFKLQTSWTAESVAVQIDSGYCTKVTPFITNVDVDSVVVSR